MTKEEALKLALEALESQIASVYDTESNAYKKCFPAITAIKEALAQDEQEPEPDALTVVYMSGVFEGRKLEREALEAEDWTTIMRYGSLVTWGDAEELGDRVRAAIRARGNT